MMRLPNVNMYIAKRWFFALGACFIYAIVMFAISVVTSSKAGMIVFGILVLLGVVTLPGYWKVWHGAVPKEPV